MVLGDSSISHLVLLFTGQFDELNGQRSGRAEILVDDKYHYYLKVIQLDIQSRTMYRISLEENVYM